MSDRLDGMDENTLKDEIKRLEAFLKHISETSVSLYNKKTQAALDAERALNGGWL